MGVIQLASFGDSLTAGDAGGFDIAEGGLGCWAEQDAERLANIAGFGPLLGPGYRGVFRTATGEWSRAGSWTQTAAGDPFDKALHGAAWYASGGTGDVSTFTPPATWRPIVGYELYWIDHSAGGDWQYSDDGGSTWHNMGQARPHDNGHKKFYVATAPTGTIKVRAYNGSGPVGILVTGIQPFFADPRGANGFIWQNLGYDGQLLHTTASVAGRMSWFDSIVLGSGSPIANAPDFTISTWINDIVRNNTAEWATDLTALYGRCKPNTVGFINPWEVNPASDPITQQADYRAQTKTTAAALGSGRPVLDLFDAWGTNGWANNAAYVAAGLLWDLGHPSQRGHNDLADRIYWWLLTKLLTQVGFVNGFGVGYSGLGVDPLGPIPQANLLTDTTLGSDTIARTLADSRTTTDTSVGADTITRTRASTRGATDNGLGSDSLTRAQADPRAATDSALGSDSLARSLADARALTDAAPGADSIAGSLSASRAASDTALGTDTVARTATDMRSDADTTLGSDAIAGALFNARAANDAALGTDAIARALADARALTDQAIDGDALSRSLAAARAMSDASLGSGSVSRHLADVRSQADMGLGTDIAIGSGKNAPNVLDNALGNDSTVRAVTFLRATADASLGADSATGTRHGATSATDASLGTDNVSRHDITSRAFADGALSAELLIRAFTATRTVHDDALGTDSTTSHAGHLVVFRNVDWSAGALTPKWATGELAGRWGAAEITARWRSDALTE